VSRILDALKKAEETRKRNSTEQAFAQAAAEPIAVDSGAAVPADLAVAPGGGGPQVRKSSEGRQSASLATKEGASSEECRAEKAPGNARVQVFASDGSELLGTEEFRRLRTKLQHARDKQPLKTILLTSAMPGEGKTFITVNLAQTITMQRQSRVLVIDADFRKPQMHAQLRVPNENGLSDFLEGRCNVAQAIKRIAGSGLEYIVGGRLSMRPAELAGSLRFAELLKQVADEYEWVLVDSPPVLPVSDAAVIARYCDAALLVISSGQTRGDLAQAAQRELQDANLLGVVLNRAARGSSYKNYHYYHYAYGGQSKNVSVR